MIQFRNGFYADVRTEDRSRTVIQYRDARMKHSSYSFMIGTAACRNLKQGRRSEPFCACMTAKCGIMLQ